MSAEQQVEGGVALEMIEEEPEHAFGSEPWIRADESFARIIGLSVEEIGNGVPGGEAGA